MYDSFAVLQFFLVFTALFWEGEHSSKTCVSPTTSQGHSLCLMQGLLICGPNVGVYTVTENSLHPCGEESNGQGARDGEGKVTYIRCIHRGRVLPRHQTNY